MDQGQTVGCYLQMKVVVRGHFNLLELILGIYLQVFDVLTDNGVFNRTIEHLVHFGACTFW